MYYRTQYKSLLNPIYFITWTQLFIDCDFIIMTYDDDSKKSKHLISKNVGIHVFFFPTGHPLLFV